MIICFHEIIDREVILPIESPRPPSYDLLKLDHRIDRAEQDDISDIPGIYTRRELLGGREDRRDGLFIVLKCSQVLLSFYSVIRGHPYTVVRLFALLVLIHDITHRRCMLLGRTKDNRLLVLIDLIHESLYSMLFSCLDLDDLIEVLLFVYPSFFHLSLDDLIVGSIYIVVEGRLHSPHLKGCQKAVVYSLLQRVGIDGISEVSISIDIVLSLWGGGQSELYSRREVLKNTSPIPLVIRTTTMTLIDDDAVKEVWRILAKIRSGPISAHEGLEDRKEYIPRRRHRAFFTDLGRTDTDAGVLWESPERIVCLTREDIAIGEEKYPRATLAIACEIPPRLEQLPSDLECDKGLARTRRERQKYTIFTIRDRVESLVDGVFLVVVGMLRATYILERSIPKRIPPLARSEIDPPEELIGSREGIHEAFFACRHTYLVDIMSVRGVGVGELELVGVGFGLGDSLGYGETFLFRLHDRELATAVDEDIVGDLTRPTAAAGLDHAEGDMILPQYP